LAASGMMAAMFCSPSRGPTSLINTSMRFPGLIHLYLVYIK
jgi:hypothetical protein